MIECYTNGRKTSKWTNSTTEAFGDTPQTRKGILAEQMYEEYANRVYGPTNVQSFPSDREHQVKGIDITVFKESWSRPYSIDVKSNLDSDGTFFVENQDDGWLRSKNKENDRVCHVCVDTGWACEYDRRTMKVFLHNHERKMIKLSVFDKELNKVIRRFKVK